MQHTNDCYLKLTPCLSFFSLTFTLYLYLPPFLSLLLYTISLSLSLPLSHSFQHFLRLFLRNEASNVGYWKSLNNRLFSVWWFFKFWTKLLKHRLYCARTRVIWANIPKSRWLIKWSSKAARGSNPSSGGRFIRQNWRWIEQCQFVSKMQTHWSSWIKSLIEIFPYVQHLWLRL